MADTSISAATDIVALVATDMLPVARSADTTAYHATLAEVLAYVQAALGGGSGYMSNVGGILQVVDATWPTDTTSLAVGALWNNGGLASVAGTTTPNPSAPPVTYGGITSAALLALGGADFPLTEPASGSGQLWNNGGVVCVA